MSINISLPDGTITLKQGSTTEDVASAVLTHNLNMVEIQNWLRSYKTAIELIATEASTSSSTTSTEIIRNSIHIPVNLTDGQSVTDDNDFTVTRTGVPSGGSNDSLEYVITDDNTERNTNFQDAIGIGVRLLTGQIVYPTIIPNLTNIRVIFAHGSEMAATTTHTGPDSTDPNVKVISFI